MRNIARQARPFYGWIEEMCGILGAQIRSFGPYCALDFGVGGRNCLGILYGRVDVATSASGSMRELRRELSHIDLGAMAQSKKWQPSRSSSIKRGEIGPLGVLLLAASRSTRFVCN